MKKISLKEYKNPIKYFKLLVVLIKKDNKNIDNFFYNKLDKAPSSFWKALNGNVRISTAQNLLEIICDYFEYKIPTNEFIDELEGVINRIYDVIYYKKTNDLQQEMLFLQQSLNQKYIIFPIVKMFIILIRLTSFNTKKVIKENENDFNEIAKYLEFYSEDLMVIYEFLDISFMQKIDEKILNKEYKNDISYYTLSGKCLLDGKYSNAIRFALVAKNSFFESNNLKRMIYTNLNIMEYYNILKKYDECYLLTNQQIATLESLNVSIKAKEFQKTISQHIISCIGLNNFDEAITYIQKTEKLNKNLIVLLLICCYYTKTDFEITNIDNLTKERKEKMTNLKVVIYRYLNKRNVNDELIISKMNIPESIKSLIIN